MARRADKIMSLLKKPSKLLTEEISILESEKKVTSQLTVSNGDTGIPAPSSSTIQNNNDADIIIVRIDSEEPKSCPVDDLENYARETEEMLIHQISQGEPFFIDLEGLNVTEVATNCSETAKLSSNEEIPCVQETLCQDKGMDETPNYMITEEEIERDSSTDTEANSNEIREENDPEESEITLEKSEKRSRSKRSKTDESKWMKQENYKRREKGLKYKGKRKENDGWNYNIEKRAKKLKPRCSCKLSRNENSKLKCFSITENARQEIFENFWRMTWGEKKTYVNTLVVVKPTKRRRGEQEISRRQTSTEFYLKVGYNQTRVCKKMFLSTLCVGEIAVKKWAKGKVIGNEQTQKPPASGLGIKKIIEFFDRLPKLESDYCRANTSKVYLETVWFSKSQLYRAYCKDFCGENNIQPMSRATFSTIFDQQNLSLYQPKKDRCDLCVAFETKNISQEEYDFHLILKNEARQEKANDKNSDNESFAMDLQSVLLCPKSNVSSLYYKTKLIVHNFTIYDLKRQQGECFLWNESEGRVTANEFATIIVHFLRKKIEASSDDKRRDYIFFSDGCAAQNRNCVLANALFNLAIEKDVTIIQKYLQKGHSQMEADSMHSTIERMIRKSRINVPADYVLICKKACLKNPYNVEYLSHDFFKKVEGNINFISSIRPGKRVGDPQVVDLKAIKYTRENIFFKLRHSELEWRTFPVRLSVTPKCVDFDSLPALYRARIPIKKEKYEHLQQLKKSLEHDYHSFYDQLPHN